MSKTINPLDAMLAQYETNNKPKYEKSASAKVYDLKNYFNTFIKEGVKTASKQIRILPTPDGSSPFIEMHGHRIKIGTDNKVFPCLKHEKSEPCPFCEAREALLATGKDSDKELAKKYGSRMYYIVKVIDREAEEEGVKFWRFTHDYSNQGILDKIQGVLLALKKDVTNPTTGRDLMINIGRDQNGYGVVKSVASLDPSVLSEDGDLSKTWLADTRTWEDVYSVKNYEYLEIIVKGGTPVWDKEAKKFVDKASLKTDAPDNLEAELTLGVENVKASVKAATTTTKTAEKPVVAEEDDELPF